MATPKEVLATLVKDGSALAGPEGVGPFVLALAEIHGKRLFFVSMFPQGQQDAHTIRFDRVAETGDGVGLSFRSGKDLVAYVSRYDEWPNVDNDVAKEDKVRWEDRLKDPERKAVFDRFVKQERDIQFS